MLLCCVQKALQCAWQSGQNAGLFALFLMCACLSGCSINVVQDPGNFKSGSFVMIASKTVFGAMESSKSTSFVYHSPDGQVWSQVASASQIRDIAVGAGVFVAVLGPEGVMTSRDGKTWTKRALPKSASLTYIAFDGKRFLALSGYSHYPGVAFASTDGVQWSAVEAPSLNFQSITCRPALCVVGAIREEKLPEPVFGLFVDGKWTKVDVSKQLKWGSPRTGTIAATKNDFVLHERQKLYRSVDGKTWKLTGTLPKVESMRLAAFRSRLFLLGKGGAFWESETGKEWKKKDWVAEKAAGTLSSMSDNGKMFLLGDVGSLWRSGDGRTWEKSPMAFPKENNTIYRVVKTLWGAHD